MSVRGRHTLVGKCAFALVVAVGVVGCSPGGPDLSELQPGDCITGQPYLYPPDIDLIDCEEANPVTDTMVVFAESAEGESYPGNLEEMNMRCVSEGGFLLKPSSETWDDGDRIGLCSTSVEMGKYRDFGQSSSSPEPDAEDPQSGLEEPDTQAEASDEESETASSDRYPSEVTPEEEAEMFYSSKEQRMLHEAAAGIASENLAEFEDSANVKLAENLGALEESMEYTDWWLTDNENDPKKSDINVIYGKFYGMERESLSITFVDEEKDMVKSIMFQNVGFAEHMPEVHGPEDIPKLREFLTGTTGTLVVEWVSQSKVSNPDEYRGLSSSDLEEGGLESSEVEETIDLLEEEMTQ